MLLMVLMMMPLFWPGLLTDVRTLLHLPDHMTKRTRGEMNYYYSSDLVV